MVTKGQLVTVSIRCMNRSEAFWGPDAKAFVPERWLTLADDDLRAKEIQGHHHVLTFSDGPRTCLGKSFALAEFKVRFLLLPLTHGSCTQLGVFVCRPRCRF